MSEREKLSSFLFDGNEKEMVNVKFFRGERELVTAEEFSGEVHSAFMQKRMGKATVSDWLDLGVKKVDVERFVADL